MKTILFLFLSFLQLVACTFAYSQSTASVSTGGVTFGIRAGINFQNLNGKNEFGDTRSNSLRVGYNAGINVEIPIAPDFYIQPGLLFSTKGAKMKNSYSVHLYYLELPVNLLFKPLLGTGHLLLGFGPYLAYGLGGTAKFNGNSTSVKFENNTDPFSVGIAYKPLDAGANLLAGYEFSNRLSFQLNAQLGLVDISPDYPNKATVKNTGFGISAGYRF